MSGAKKEYPAKVNGVKRTKSLVNAVHAQTPWPTPRASSPTGGGIGLDGGAGSRAMLDKKVGPEMRAKMITGRLNPDWVEWLMGYPIGWTDIRTRWEPMKQYDIGIEPVDDVPRLTPYQSNRTKRLKALGNAVVPQCVEIIARLLLDKRQKA